MNFFKRATTSIVRRPGKTVILLLLVFILGTVIAGAISVEGAISNTDANLRRNMQPIVSIEMNHQDWANTLEGEYFDWITTFPPHPPALTVDHVRAIGALDYVGFYDYIIEGWLQSFDLSPYTADGRTGFGGMDGEPRSFTLRGTSTHELVQVEQGIMEVVQGRQFEESELVAGGDRSAIIVSEAFANYNNLALHSTITLYHFVMFPDEDGELWGWGTDWWADDNIYARVGMEFEIIGFYDIPLGPDVDENHQDYWDRVTHVSSTMYVPNWAIEDVDARREAALGSVWDAVDVEQPEWMTHGPEEAPERSVTPLFRLEDPTYLDDFRAAATPLLPDHHMLVDLSSTFDGISSSMATLQTISDWILYVSIGATLLILSLLITLFLRDRRYEMGVYLALGEKKGKIITQILMEVLVTSVVAITLSVFVGHLLSSQMSRAMLINQLQAEQSDDHWNRDWTIFDQIGIPTNQMSVDEMIDAFEVSLGIETVGLFYIIGLGAVVLSTLVPVVYVVTLNPKKVLM
ncbi:MAG: ABC transporter permease [Defluviitaleaceae bacterium]|nr:ABC transporter permease [Defluviitaleaceae bacterium]